MIKKTIGWVWNFNEKPHTHNFNYLETKRLYESSSFLIDSESQEDVLVYKCDCGEVKLLQRDVNLSE